MRNVFIVQNPTYEFGATTDSEGHLPTADPIVKVFANEQDALQYLGTARQLGNPGEFITTEEVL